MDGYMTPMEASRRLGVSRGRIGQLMREGQIKTLMTPFGRLVKTDSLEQLQKKRQEQQGCSHE